MAFLHSTPPRKAEEMNPEQKFGFFFGANYTKVSFPDISTPGTGATTPDCLDIREESSFSQDSSSGIVTPPEFEGLNILPPPGLVVSEIADAVVQPPPPPSDASRWPSVGSIGHPECCAEACKYVKRKGGCRHGEACPQCHLCFWQRTPAQPSQQQKDVPSVSCVAAYSSKPDSQQMNAKEKAKKESIATDPDLMTIGSLNHPVGCAAPCRYVNRKGGCKNGKACPECHFCHWRRNLPAKANAEDVDPASSANAADFALDATEHLQRLIFLQLACSNPFPPPASSCSSKQWDKSESSTVASMLRQESGTQAPALNRNLIASPPPGLAPAPGLEHEESRLLFMNSRFLSGQSSVGTVSPR